MTLSLVADGLLSLLLIATIAYAALLNRKLSELRGSKEEIESCIAEFNDATSRAERGLAAVREEAEGSGDTLQKQVELVEERIVAGQRLSDDLGFLLDKANAAADRLEQAVAQARRPAGHEDEVPRMPSLKGRDSAPLDTVVGTVEPPTPSTAVQSAGTDKRPHFHKPVGLAKRLRGKKRDSAVAEPAVNQDPDAEKRWRAGADDSGAASELLRALNSIR